MLGSLFLRYFLFPDVRMENSMESWAGSSNGMN